MGVTNSKRFDQAPNIRFFDTDGEREQGEKYFKHFDENTGWLCHNKEWYDPSKGDTGYGGIPGYIRSEEYKK